MTSADDIADGVVAMLNALETSIAFQAVNPPNVPEIDREVNDATVQVYPFEETEEPTDRGDMVKATRVVSVIVQAPLKTDRARKDCIAWLNELKAAFTEQTISGYRWGGNTTDSLYDFDAMAQKRQFLSVFKATFFSFE